MELIPNKKLKEVTLYKLNKEIQVNHGDRKILLRPNEEAYITNINRNYVDYFNFSMLEIEMMIPAKEIKVKFICHPDNSYFSDMIF